MRKKAGYGKSMKKAKSGSKVKKAGYGKSMKAKAGKKVKKMGYGGKAASMVPPKSKMKAKAGKKLKKPTAKQVGLKKLPTAVRNKMGYAKKGKAVAKKAKSGGRMKKCKYGCK